jgi:peroxiredoxin
MPATEANRAHRIPWFFGNVGGSKCHIVASCLSASPPTGLRGLGQNAKPLAMKACSVLLALALFGCADKSSQPATATSESAAAAPAGNAAVGQAEVGKAAPNFKLKDLDGKEVELASFKGKTVVLEWFNPGCPYVKKSHGKGSLKGYAKTVTEKGAVWLSINSGAPGKQGAGVDANREGAKELGVENPILLDEAGTVGKAYGATNTPHMYVVDPSGTLVYAGAIDNSPDAEGESPEGGTLVNYVAAAVDAIDQKKPVGVAKTKAYGCSVKYQ